MAKRKPDRKMNPPVQKAALAKAELHGVVPGAVERQADRWRPWLLAVVAALFAARPLFPSEAAATQGDGLPIVMLWLALAIFWLLAVVGRRSFGLRFCWIDGAMAVLVGLHSLAALWAAWDSNPRPAINMLWEWVAFGTSYWLVRQLVSGQREARAVIVVMVGVAVGIAGQGLYQYGYELPRSRAEYHRDPDAALRSAGMWYEPGSREREMFEKRLESVEPLGTFALTNSLAGYLAPWLVVALGIGASWLRTGRLRQWLPVMLVAAPVAVCLLLTKSRSGYVAALFGTVLVGLLIPGRLRVNWKLLGVAVGVGAVLLGIAMAVGGVDRFVLSEASKSLGYRLEYWQATGRMIADHPLAGCGPGHFQHAYTAYKLPQASEEIADPHNFLLEVWATAGTPTMLALLVVLGGLVVSAMRCVATKDDADGCPMHVLGGGFAGFLLSIPLGLMSSAPPGLSAVMIGLPLAVGTAVLLWPWVDRGTLPRALPAIGALVLLVNLLAAGGIGLPGVAGTLWLLVAISVGEAYGEFRPLSYRWGLAALGGVVAVAVACYASAYSPVMRYQAAMRMVEREPHRIKEHLKEAAAADPLAAAPWTQLANLAFHAWQQQPSAAMYREFDKAAEEALTREPRSAAAWFHWGGCYSQVFDRTKRPEDLTKAIGMYQQAVSLYPNSAIGRARLAEAFRAAGRQAEFQREAEEALRLDAVTPHLDKKLPADVRESLKPSGSTSK